MTDEHTEKAREIRDMLPRTTDELADYYRSLYRDAKAAIDQIAAFQSNDSRGAALYARTAKRDLERKEREGI